MKIEYVLTPEDRRWMRVARAALDIELRVRASLREAPPHVGAQLDPAPPLFFEAARALMSRLPTASVVLCRGCLEATLHAALVRMNLGNRRFALRISPAGSRSGLFPGLAFLLRESVSSGILGASLSRSAWLIKEDGDFSAHLAARRDSGMLTSSVTRRDTLTGLTTWKPVRLWVGESRALSNLRVMERILRRVTQRARDVSALSPAAQILRLSRMPLVPRSE